MNRLERRLWWLGLSNMTAVIIAGQAVFYAANTFRRMNEQSDISQYIGLSVPKVLSGEVWRLASFIFVPPPTRVILFAFFGWMLFYVFGSTLERLWGSFRYNVFLLTALAANIVAAFIAWYVWRVPEPALSPTILLGQTSTAANVLLYGSVFLAFARICPDMIINLFFVLPIRIKWLALAAWIAYAYSLIRYDWSERLFIVASLLNYAIFFGRDHWRDFKQGHRRRSFLAKTERSLSAPKHACRVCGISSVESPRMLFRYCSQCEGQVCYCPEHIRDHAHVAEKTPSA